MKALIRAGGTMLLVLIPGAALAQGAWCSEDMNARNCGFYTLEQCQAAASGLGGGCSPNQFAASRPAPQPPKRGKRVKRTR